MDIRSRQEEEKIRKGGAIRHLSRRKKPIVNCES